MQLTYDEIIDVLNLKYIPKKRMGYSLKTYRYNVVDLNNTLKTILHVNVKISVTIDEKKHKSNLKINQTLIFTNRSSFYTILGFIQSNSYPLDDIDGFYQLIAGSSGSDKPINITGNDKVHLKCDCIYGSIVNGTREPILYSFANRSSFYTILGFIQSNSYPLDDIDGFYQLIAGSYGSDKPINITGNDKVHLKCDCIYGSIVNGTREPILYSFALSSPPGYKLYKEPRVKLFKKINKSVLSHISFYLEDDDYKPIDFNNEIVSFTCQLIKLKNLYLYTYNYISFT